MRVLFDHQIFTYQEFGGISRYFYELINYYQASGILDAQLPLRFTNNHYLNEDPHYSYTKNFLKDLHLSGKAHGLKVRLMAAFNQNLVLEKIESADFDLFHPTFYDTYFLEKMKGKPFVLTIYDLIEEKFNKKADRTSRSKHVLASKAAKIISISEHTKKDIIELYNIPADKIEVVYLGNSLSPAASEKKTALPEKYILFVGKRGGYKNFDAFIKSFSRLRNEVKEDIQVICIGGGGLDNRELELLGELHIKDYVKQFGADDRELYHYYHNALFFVFPSLYEGFGIPLLEAFASGCPVLSSNRTSLPEIAGEAALYFNASEENSMYQKMFTLYNDKHLRDELISRGYHHLKKFSWKRTAEQTREVYRSVL